jgi:hypothetical protein
VTSALLIARLALAVLFLVAGAAKLSDRAGSHAALSRMGLPASLATPLALALPVVELITAFALLPAGTATWGAWAALVLLGAFTFWTAAVLVRGVDTDCHCFGRISSGPVRWSTLARNVVLATVAAWVIAGQRTSGSPSYLDWLGGLSTTEGLALSAVGLGLSLLLAGIWFGLHLMRQQGRILLRLDALEKELSAQGLISARRLTDAPTEGPLAGQPVPAFTAPNLEGNSSSLSDLLAPGYPLLLIFVRPSCIPCTELLPEIARWQGVLAGRFTIGVVSQGTISENRLKLAGAGIRRALVQRELEISHALAVHTTPSALLISPEGTVAHNLEVGAAAIRRLVGSISPAPAAVPRLPVTPEVTFDAG